MAKTLALFTAALLIGAALRLHNIEERPLQSDEGVNYYFVRELRRTGIAPYSTSQFHGPLYFYNARAFADLVATKICESQAPECFKDNEFGMRLGSIVSGIFLLLAPLLLLGLVPSEALVFMSALFATSPLLTFYSRTAIHESLFILLSTVLGFALYRFMQKPGGVLLFILGIGGSLLLATKETCIILFAAVFVASLTGQAEARNFLYKNYLLLISATAVFFGCTFLLFGAGNEALLLPIKGIAGWVDKGTGDGIHIRPLAYFFDVLLGFEPMALLGLVCALTLFVARVRQQFRFFGIWALLTFLIYSLIPYKTPWLSVNLIAPALICLALQFSNINNTALRYFVFAAVLATQFLFTLNYNFSAKRDFSQEILAADTHDDVRQISSDVIDYCRERGPECRIYIGLKYYWPLPFYLQEYYNFIAYNPGKTFEEVQNQVQVVMLPDVIGAPPQNWDTKKYRLSPLQEVTLLMRRNRLAP